MKKKLLSISLVLAVLLLGTGIYTTFASSSGYETYKQALKETHKTKNGASNMEIIISDGSSVLEQISVQSKYNLDENQALVNFNLESADQDIQLQMQKDGNEVYIKNGEDDTVYSLQKDSSKEDFEKHHNKEFFKVAELVVDTLMKPLQDNFVAGPDHTISINIENDEMPAAIQALGSYMVKNGLKHHADAELTTEEYPFLTKSFKQQLPQLVEDITFKKIAVNAQLSESGLIKEQQAILEISGKDEAGQQQTLTLQINQSLQSIENTIVPTFTLEGKTIETIQLKDVHDFH